MDDSSDEDFVPDLPPDCDKILFCTDLVGYMLFRNSPNFDLACDPIPFRDYVYNAFDQITQRAIRFLDNAFEMEHDDIFCDIRNANLVNPFIYETLAEKLAANYFPEGFDAEYFLTYCVNLSRMAAYFYNHGILIAPELAKQHLFRFLREFDMSAGGWNTLHRIAEKYEKMLQDSTNELTPESIASDEIEPHDRALDEMSEEKSRSSSSEELNVLTENEEKNFDEKEERACSRNKLTPESIASDEIEPHDRAQDEASDEKSRSSSSEDLNVLSENEEKNFEEQERASSRNEPSLKKSASESSSQIGLSPLRSSPEDTSPTFNFEDNKPIDRSGSKDKQMASTSNIDQDSIFIKSDCKRRMYLSWNEVKRGYLQTLSLKGSKLTDKSASDDRFCPGPSSAFQESFLDKSDCKQKVDLSLKKIKCGNSQTLSFEGNKLTSKSISDDRFCPGPSRAYLKSSFLRKSNCKGKLYPSLKDNKNSESSSSEEDASIDNYSSDDRFRKGTPNTYHKSSLTSRRDCKRKLDLSSEKKNGANYPSMNFNGNNLVSKSGPNEKFVPGVLNTDQMCVSSNIKLDISSNKENNANVQNISLTNGNKSPKLTEISKPLKLERYSLSPEATEKSPSKVNLKKP